MTWPLLLLSLTGCAAHLHLEVGARHDANGPDLHAGASLAIGFQEGGNSQTRTSVATGVGADVDSERGGRMTGSLAYLGGGPGLLMHGVRFSYLHKANVRLGGSLLYVVHEHDRGGRCWFGDDADCHDREVTIGAVGLQVSATVENEHPGVATDIVFDLLY